MGTLVLVPGAGLPGEAWRDVCTHLRRLGHDAVPVTLRGLGARHDEATPETDLTDHVADVVDGVGGRDDVVLVGHSAAALTVWEALPELAGRVRHVVLVGGTPLPVGTSPAGELGEEAMVQVRALVDAAGGGWRVPPFPRELVDAIFPDHRFDDDSWARYVELSEGHPFATMHTPARVAADDADVTARRTHVTLLGDPGPRPSLPAPWEQVEFDSGHWPMFTRPVAFAELLDGLATARAADTDEPATASQAVPHDTV